MKNEHNQTCVVISGCWPGNKKGYEIACNSTLSFIVSKYKRVVYLGPEDETFDAEFRNNFLSVEFIAVDFFRSSKALRFLESLFSKYPAICMRFKRSVGDVRTILDELGVNGCDFFYEDIPAAYFLNEFKSAFNNSYHIVRSHNAVYKGFFGMKHKGNIISRLAWTFELIKIKKFEQCIAKKSDYFIAISDDDKEYYNQINVHVNSVLSVYFEPVEDTVETVNSKNLIHIGTSDMRKGASLRKFIYTVWPKIFEEFPNSQFFIAGKGTEIFDDKKNGVIALGFIDNESQLFNKGRIFINPQEEGAGIKIKSLVALRNKSALVTTSVGVEGINVSHGKSALVSASIGGMEEHIRTLLSSEDEILKISTEGFNFFHKNYSQNSFFSQAEYIWSHR
ncbi:Glycosyltransferase [Moritella sp. PE36]|uniref:glycosyltransferase family 4 protein n=1 Tax=Moritella sp. PE36 TaxID=58051 RepID=UPI0001568313|nr:glycosyltransferase family 4 protein [Moritella sp. PE36]EDM69072.1 Glycosyltransferase [Moritella sp. PE36]